MKYNNTTAAILCSAFVALNGQETAASAPELVHRSTSQASYYEYCGRDLKNLREHAAALGKNAIQVVKSYAALSKDLSVPTIVCGALLIFDSKNKTDATLGMLQMASVLPLTQAQTKQTQALKENLEAARREKENKGTVSIQTRLNTAGQAVNTLYTFTPNETTDSTVDDKKKVTVSAEKNKTNEIEVSKADKEATEKLSRIAKNTADLATSTVKSCEEAVRAAYDAVKIAAKSIHWTCIHLKNKVVQLLSEKKASAQKAAGQQFEVVKA